MACRNQRIESVRIQKVKRLHHDICGQLFAVVPNTDAAHTCSARSFNACNCVFDHNTSFWRHADSRSRRQEYFRIRLASAYVFRRDDRLEQMTRPEGLEDNLDIRARRRGSDSLKPSLLMQGVHPVGDSLQG